MWVFTTIGFFSVVQKSGTTLLTVRARVAADLDNLRQRFMPQLSQTIIGKGTDYPFRATISHRDFAVGLSKMGEAIDYHNFKNEVARRLGDERGLVYHKVWSNLRTLENESTSRR